MANHNPYDPFRNELQPGRQHQEGGDYGWSGPGERRSFDDARGGYGQYSREDETSPAYGGQGAYGQGRGPGQYGYGLQSGGNREDYAYGGQGGFGPSGGGYGARERNVHQGRRTYGDDPSLESARRSESRQGVRGGYGGDRDDYEQFVGGREAEHYQRWHAEQMRAHDRDYARWREERANQYHREYNDWRNQRSEAFSRDFNDWRTRQSQAPVQDVTDGGDGSHHDRDDDEQRS
jgi:hypothetical protein